MLFYTTSLKFVKEKYGTQDNLIGGILSHKIGMILKNLDKFQEAIEQLKYAISSFSQDYGPHSEELGLLYNDIGECYYRIDSFSNCVLFYERAMDVFKANGNNSNLALVENNLGAYYIQMNRTQEALNIYLDAQEHLQPESEEDYVLLATIWDGIGNIYMGLKEYKDAE